MQLSIPITFEVRITAEDGTDADDVLEDLLLHWSPLRPARAVADCPYAGYVEFGTRPAENRSDRDVKEELRRWAKGKLGADDAAAERIASSVYRKILLTGILPMPFFRPAIFDTLSEVREDWLDAGHSLADIAEGIVFRARNMLEKNDQNWTGELSLSLTAQTGTQMPTAPDPASEPEGEIDEHVWESAELAWDGVTRPDFRRWHR